jgi:ABC-type uncharacterized transport system auxiliary subunit
MKMKIVAILMFAAALSGCTTSNEFGQCIGAFDDKKPDTQYRLSTKNTVLAIVFIETIFVPVIVLASETQCPVATGK